MGIMFGLLRRPWWEMAIAFSLLFLVIVGTMIAAVESLATSTTFAGAAIFPLNQLIIIFLGLIFVSPLLGGGITGFALEFALLFILGLGMNYVGWLIVTKVRSSRSGEM